MIKNAKIILNLIYKIIQNNLSIMNYNHLNNKQMIRRTLYIIKQIKICQWSLFKAFKLIKKNYKVLKLFLEMNCF